MLIELSVAKLQEWWDRSRDSVNTWWQFFSGKDFESFVAEWSQFEGFYELEGGVVGYEIIPELGFLAHGIIWNQKFITNGEARELMESYSQQYKMPIYVYTVDVRGVRKMVERLGFVLEQEACLVSRHLPVRLHGCLYRWGG